jgi:NADPH-dependent ferric siderophore reductase
MPLLTARAIIPFPKVDDYYETIKYSFSAHNMELEAADDGYRITSPLGEGHLSTRPGELILSVSAQDASSYNRLKHELTGLVGFVTRPENLEITWQGDTLGAMLPADLRVLTVETVEALTPRMRRVVFRGDDLAHYDTAEQIHCRLLFQGKGVSQPEWPTLDDNGRILWPDHGKLASRIFTIRAIDAAAGRLTIDFVLHGRGGPGCRWAEEAEPGDIVGILGPAAYGPRPAKWVLLAGDETGLPGIARILENLPDSCCGAALIEVADASEEQPLSPPPGVSLHWLHRNGAAAGTTSLLPDALQTVPLPDDRQDVFCWVGAEYSAFRTMRHYLRQTAGFDRKQMIAFSHWRHGMSEEDIVEAGITSVTA